MRLTKRIFLAAAVCIAASGLHAQAAPAEVLPLPTTRASVAAYDVAMVKRMMQLLDSPAHWNRDDTGRCPATATSFTIACAMQGVLDSAAAQQRVGSGNGQTACRMRRVSQVMEGSCGLLFEELPIFTMSRVAATTTGRWRDDASPTFVWSGTMTDAAAPVRSEARRTVDAVTTKKYPGRLDGYNRDSTVTFADLRKYLSVLADRVAANAVADMAEGGDSVEVEIFSGGAGVIRTYQGWFTVTNFVATDSTIRFQFDPEKEVAPNGLDKRILERAAAILSADSVWNRADDRKCPASARTWSIYCAVEQAQRDVAGGFHHRRPAGELVREIVDQRTRSRNYNHRMMDYNNDATTTLADVRSLFAEAIARIKP